MSIHPSLRTSKGKGHRSVFKRFERMKMLSEKDKWHEGESVFGLPKVKSIKIRVKKGKAAEAKVATEAAATPTAETTQAAPTTTQAAANLKATPTKKEKPEQTKEKETK
ncbi:MAG: small basic protein [Candidatus Omnitrophota bacterium]